MPLDKEISGILDPLLGTFDEKLEAEIAGQLTEVYISGQAEMITWGKTKGGIPIAYEGPPIQGAIDWAGEHAATLVKGLDEETQRRLAHTISEGIKNKRGVPGLSRDIRNTFDDMSKYRGELIARTETATALSQSSLDNMEAMGIEGKEWVTVGDADVSTECLGNEAEGVIPVGKEFSGGVMAPGQHPNCRCALAPGRIAKKVAKPAPPPTEPVSPEMKNLIDNKLKVGGKRQTDIDGLQSTLEAIKSANLPDSHLATIRSIELNTAKVQKVRGAFAYADGSNNIVLAGKVGEENVVHEIGHTFFQRKILVRGNQDKYKIADIFNASTKSKRGFVSEYAKVDVDEFFAESYAAFAGDSKAFTKLNPSMGKLLKGYWK